MVNDPSHADAQQLALGPDEQPRIPRGYYPAQEDNSCTLVQGMMDPAM
jgi:hypothetical protein